jgi:hypothetical protein
MANMRRRYIVIVLAAEEGRSTLPLPMWRGHACGHPDGSPTKNVDAIELWRAFRNEQPRERSNAWGEVTVYQKGMTGAVWQRACSERQGTWDPADLNREHGNLSQRSIHKGLRQGVRCMSRTQYAQEEYGSQIMRLELAYPGFHPCRILSRPVIQKSADMPLAARKDGDFQISQASRSWAEHPPTNDSQARYRIACPRTPG